MNSGIRGFSLELWLFWAVALQKTVLTLPRAPGTESEDSIKPAGWLETLVIAQHNPPFMYLVVWVLGWSREGNQCFRLADLTQREADNERNTQSADKSHK